MSEDGSNIKELSLDHVIIPDVHSAGGEGLSGEDIDTPSLTVFLMGFLHHEEGVLSIKSRVFSESAGNN